MEAFQRMPGWEQTVVIGGLLFVAIVVCFFVGAAIVASLNDSRRP